MGGASRRRLITKLQAISQFHIRPCVIFFSASLALRYSACVYERGPKLAIHPDIQPVPLRFSTEGRGLHVGPSTAGFVTRIASILFLTFPWAILPKLRMLFSSNTHRLSLSACIAFSKHVSAWQYGSRLHLVWRPRH